MNALPLRLPPVRQRQADLPARVQHFWEKHANDQRSDVTLPDRCDRFCN